MGIWKAEKKRIEDGALEATRLGATAYSKRLQAALDVILDFDAKAVDDIKDFRRSLEVTGTPSTLMTTREGYQCLIGVDGELMASNIPEVAE